MIMNEKMNATLGNAFPKERIRYAMLSFFLAQGLCFSSWASRIPDVKDIFEVNYAFYWGLVLFLIPVGKFVAIPLAGYLVSKLGSRIMAQVSVLGYALALFAIGTAHNLSAGCLFVLFWGVLESLRYILEYARNWYRATLWAYDYGLISWRLESGGLFRGFDRVYHDRIRCYSVLAFYVDCIIDWSDCFGKPEVFAGRRGG